MTALEIRGLTAGYGRTTVLQGVDLHVGSGVTAILGSSGCGKTTLLRAVAGFVEPTAGTIAVAGRPVVGGPRPVPARDRGIGYVPQEGALFPHLSVARNVAFGLPRSRRRDAGAVVAEALQLVELDPALAERYPHELSGGQQQRVALARALAPRPALVLLDEPFSSLDASLREETGRAVVRALRAAGAAAVLVTHDQGEALSLADQVAVMVAGQFLQVAAPASVYLSPADPRVAAFIGHASLLPGEVLGEGRGRCALGEVTLRSGGSAGTARFAVRSEQLQVRPSGSADGVPGEVVDVSFFGHDATIRVRLASGEQVTARTPADSVPAAGDQVRVVVVGDVIAFAD
ncbi:MULTISPECIES: ABC transporter ATP-binding protein [unclassified Nocardioides]|uniref:ABC transporter ATP-binding protein n=1 Tax=unclassified Nocardioides TaxID=2615069 RepID=UPI00114F3D9E|nr:MULTISPECIES: ABC transporter ATP-binding protein [unclassified Nocardioides]TQK73044.1 iron(III) transport system ATP-binding protein [Nocardioides sp. SLBN-35]WGY02717.1 ABC transporter ATP-binding protein [Nocardioides sp. QY071]